MWPTLFGLSLVVGFVLGSFVMWRQLRDDYDGEKLLTLWLWLVVAAWVGSGVWVWWSGSGRQLYGAVGFPVLVLLWWSRRLRWNFWELLDVFAPLTLAVMILAALGWGLGGTRAAAAAVGGVILAAVVRRWYRHFGWYKSGKVGLVGIVALAWWAVVNLVIANFSLWAVYSLGWAAVVALVTIYLRSGRRIESDLAKLWPKKT